MSRKKFGPETNRRYAPRTNDTVRVIRDITLPSGRTVRAGVYEVAATYDGDPYLVGVRVLWEVSGDSVIRLRREELEPPATIYEP